MSSNGAAALTSSLIPRKGTAEPAGYIGPRIAPASQSRPSENPGPRLNKATGRSEIEGERARITLRLDPERHLRLKLAAAHMQRNLQDLVTEALDLYLDAVGPDFLEGRCACLDNHPDNKNR